MHQPRTKDLSLRQAQVAREIGGKLRDAGKEAWLVGGVVRDLALGLKPNDVDLATDATPDEIESVFGDTLPVGRAFGTVIVRVQGLDCEVTTFRSESSYSDARHPDRVTFSKTAEEDSLRRDFTCNALYLDPVDDQFLDPTGGLADLAAGRLRCVGAPQERFREDALRILRLARFAAQPGLEPEPETLAAAMELAPNLQRIAPERRLREVASILTRSDIPRALTCLDECGALAWTLFEGDSVAAANCRERIALFRERNLPGAAGFAALFGSFELEASAWRKQLEAMRPARELLRDVDAIGRGVRELEELVALGKASPRSKLIRALRSPSFAASLELASARAAVSGSDIEELDALNAFQRERDSLAPSDLNPELLLRSADLEAAKVPRGPLWGELLLEGETRQLDGEFLDRESALAWLTTRASEL